MEGVIGNRAGHYRCAAAKGRSGDAERRELRTDRQALRQQGRGVVSLKCGAVISFHNDRVAS